MGVRVKIQLEGMRFEISSVLKDDVRVLDCGNGCVRGYGSRRYTCGIPAP